MVAIVCLTRPDRVESLIEAAFSVVERHIGVVSISDAEVLRVARF